MSFARYSVLFCSTGQSLPPAIFNVFEPESLEQSKLHELMGSCRNTRCNELGTLATCIKTRRPEEREHALHSTLHSSSTVVRTTAELFCCNPSSHQTVFTFVATSTWLEPLSRQLEQRCSSTSCVCSHINPRSPQFVALSVMAYCRICAKNFVRHSLMLSIGYFLWMSCFKATDWRTLEESHHLKQSCSALLHGSPDRILSAVATNSDTV